jgi:hypothetical protein
MAKTQELMYAVVGAGDYAVDKVKGFKRLTDRDTSQKLYKDFVKRGRKLSTRIKNSNPGKQVRAQADVARKQVNEATKGVQKAIGVNQTWPKRTSSPPRKKTTSKSTARKTTAKAP